MLPSPLGILFLRRFTWNAMGILNAERKRNSVRAAIAHLSHSLPFAPENDFPLITHPRLFLPLLPLYSSYWITPEVSLIRIPSLFVRMNAPPMFAQSAGRENRLLMQRHRQRSPSSALTRMQSCSAARLPH